MIRCGFELDYIDAPTCNVRTIKRTVINNPNIYLCRVRSLGYSHQIITGGNEKTRRLRLVQPLPPFRNNTAATWVMLLIS